MLRDIRRQYNFSTLNEKDLHRNPFDQFADWLEQVMKSEEPEPTAMVISTIDQMMKPQSRIVLLKDFNKDGFVFYTNYEGNKAHQIQKNDHVALLFFWSAVERQVRITGKAEKVADEISEEYFNSRPAESKLAAWASEQSTVIPSAEYLGEKYKFYEKKFGDNIPRPPHWGGYIVKPETIEFWQGRPNRLHDRLIYSKLHDGEWKIERLSP